MAALPTEVLLTLSLAGKWVVGSDESEPSWLEPQLELKDFQLGSAQLVTFFPSARNRKSAENEPKFLFLFILFFIFVYVAKS